LLLRLRSLILITAEDDEGSTSLHEAAEEGHQEVAQLLLTKGADVKAKDRFGLAPLNTAAREGH
jgi:ankyrin repeat protein